MYPHCFASSGSMVKADAEKCNEQIRLNFVGRHFWRLTAAIQANLSVLHFGKPCNDLPLPFVLEHPWTAQYPIAIKQKFHAKWQRPIQIIYANPCIDSVVPSGRWTSDVTTRRAPSLDGFRHLLFYCSNFAVKYLLIIADISVIKYSGELMFNIMICNITKIRIPLSICTSSEVVLSSMCRLNDTKRDRLFHVT